MRMIVIKQSTDFKSLGTLLLGPNAGSSKTLEVIKQLNPHVDFNRITAGSVLLIPDAPDLKAGETVSVSGETFGAFTQQAMAGFDAAATRVSAAHSKRLTDQKEFSGLLKLAAIKRALESDPELKNQFDAASEVFKQDQVQAKVAEESLKLIKEGMGAEFAALAKLLG